MSWQRVDLPIEANGGVATNVQDQTSDIAFGPLYIDQNTGNLLASPTAINDYTISLSPGHGAIIGDIIVLRENSHHFWAEILSFATDVATIDRPLDYAFSTGSEVSIGDANLNKNGSGTVVTGHLVPPIGTSWDVTRLHVRIVDNVVMDSAKFGGISALTRGVVLRRVNGNYKVIANAKSNGDLATFAYSDKYDDKAPAGVYGFLSKYVFGGQGNAGVAIRLEGVDADELQVLVQDDLTDLILVQVIAIGHVVVD
jgi:hypothetical protein